MTVLGQQEPHAERRGRGHVDELQAERQARQPDEQAQVQGHRRRHRPRRRVGGGDARRARLPGRRVHVPRLAAPGPLDRRPGRHQRGQELPGRRRLGAPPVLRHGQGRRLPRPRVATCTAWPRSASTSSTRWSPRACPSPASTAACSTTAASAARRSAARSTPGARPASSCCSAPTSRWRARSGSARSGCSTASSWSTSSPSTVAAPASSPATCSTGSFQSHAAHAVVLATGGYGNVFFLSTNAMTCNVTAAWRAHRKGAFFANPCYTQIHPTCIPQADDTQSKLTLMSESLRNDGRVWVPLDPDEKRPADQIPEAERDYVLERLYPSFGNLAPRDMSSRAAKRAVDVGRGVGPLKNGVYLDFADGDRPPRARRRAGALREPVRDVRAHRRREPVRRADAHLSGQSTTRWAGSGSTTS